MIQKHTYAAMTEPDCPLQITGYAVLVHLTRDATPYSAFGTFNSEDEALAVIDWLNEPDKDYHIWPLVFLKPTALVPPERKTAP